MKREPSKLKQAAAARAKEKRLADAREARRAARSTTGRPSKIVARPEETR